MLFHASSKVDACLSYVFAIWVAAANLFIDSFLVEFMWASFVRAAEYVA